MSTAKLILEGREVELPSVRGSEQEKAIDITRLRPESMTITLDPGFANTGACRSAITFIDGERGILRYRGYPIEALARGARFTEVCFLLIYGHLPTRAELDDFRNQLTYHTLIHEDMKKFFEGYPPSAHPMAILSAMVSALSTRTSISTSSACWPRPRQSPPSHTRNPSARRFSIRRTRSATRPISCT